jgi:hypothetical protein
MHQRDPEGIAIVFNTEMRGKFQSGMFSTIDKDRLIAYDSNRPEDIFDRFEKEHPCPMIQDGMPLRIVCIDSLTAIGETKALSADRSVNDHLVGDHALTINKGLDKIVPYCKRHNILLICSSQMRANVDASNPHAPKERMAESWKVKHTFEYFMSIKHAGSADDKVDIEGNKFEDESVKDARGNKDQTGKEYCNVLITNGATHTLNAFVYAMKSDKITGLATKTCTSRSTPRSPRSTSSSTSYTTPTSTGSFGLSTSVSWTRPATLRD